MQMKKYQDLNLWERTKYAENNYYICERLAEDFSFEFKNLGSFGGCEARGVYKGLDVALSMEINIVAAVVKSKGYDRGKSTYIKISKIGANLPSAFIFPKKTFFSHWPYFSNWPRLIAKSILKDRILGNRVHDLSPTINILTRDVNLELFRRLSISDLDELDRILNNDFYNLVIYIDKDSIVLHKALAFKDNEEIYQNIKKSIDLFSKIFQYLSDKKIAG